MLSQSFLAALSLLPLSQAETVLGVYVFHRHGDRTAKAYPPANLTDLGYQEVFTSGDFYRNRWISSNATNQIYGISPDLVANSQISVSAPADTVLQNSATGFLQGLYPAVGATLGSQTLANGTNVTTPLGGYQLIPVGLVSSGSGGESTAWLQSTTGCGEATISSNEYYTTSQYSSLLSSTQDFYDNISPVVNTTFNSSSNSYKNAFTIFDYLNVAEIHNASIPSSSLLTTDVLFQLRTLADQHEWNLAYNASSPVRSIAGATLAAQIAQFLNTTITGKGKSKIGIQFGNYATFASYYGLAGLQNVNPDFYGVTDYASAMAFELVTNATVSASAPIPDTSDISVRFIFHNGTTSDISPPVAYPLFGSDSLEMPWTTFLENMNNISVGTTEQWCTVCQNTTGTCAAYASASNSSSSSSGSGAGTTQDGKSNGLSPAVNGVIGAMVTLAVVLGLEALVLLVGGLRVVRKNRIGGQGVAGENVQPKA